MTEEEGKDRLIQFVENKVKNSGWLIFFKRDLQISFPRILEPYEKSANLSLPEKLILAEIEIDPHGILYRRQELIEWKAICATGILSERISKNGTEDDFKRHLLVILHSGDIVPFYIGNISRFKGLFGHFVELYKTQKGFDDFLKNSKS